MDAQGNGIDAVQIGGSDVRAPRLSRAFGALLTAASLLFDASPSHGAEAGTVSR